MQFSTLPFFVNSTLWLTLNSQLFLLSFMIIFLATILVIWDLRAMREFVGKAILGSVSLSVILSPQNGADDARIDILTLSFMTCSFTLVSLSPIFFFEPNTFPVPSFIRKLFSQFVVFRIKVAYG